MGLALSQLFTGIEGSGVRSIAGVAPSSNTGASPGAAAGADAGDVTVGWHPAPVASTSEVIKSRQAGPKNLSTRLHRLASALATAKPLFAPQHRLCEITAATSYHPFLMESMPFIAPRYSTTRAACKVFFVKHLENNKRRRHEPQPAHVGPKAPPQGAAAWPCQGHRAWGTG
jgi:hypothetical protein